MSIIINGGGVISFFFALILSKLTKNKLNIHLISPYLFEDKINQSFDSRTIALTWGTCCTLMSFGIWQFLSPYVTAISEIEISSDRDLSKIFISANDYKLPYLGYSIKLKDIGTVLLDLLRTSLNVTLHCPASLKMVKRKQNINLVVLNNGCKIYAKLLVAADGPYSPLASICGINWYKYDYQQSAIISDITTALSHNYYAFEKITRHGSIALLPVLNKCSALIWCCPISWKQKISICTSQQFCNILQKIFGWSLGKIINASSLNFYSLYLYVANRHISHRLALIGSAAQTLHPLAGQALNLGLRDAVILADILAKVDNSNEDIGDYSVLNKYQNNRRLDQNVTSHLVHRTVCLLNSNNSKYHSLLTFRDVGWFAVSRSHFLCRVFKKILSNWIVR